MTLYDPFRPSRDSGGYRGPGRGHHLSRDKPEAENSSDRFWPKCMDRLLIASEFVRGKRKSLICIRPV